MTAREPWRQSGGYPAWDGVERELPVVPSGPAPGAAPTPPPEATGAWQWTGDEPIHPSRCILPEEHGSHYWRVAGASRVRFCHGKSAPGGRVGSGEPKVDLDTSAKLSALSRWIDEAPANAARDKEAALWGRVAKVGEEHGEVIAALIGATGQNPRKGITHGILDVEVVLLDVALTALCAVEHLNSNPARGVALRALAHKIDSVYVRAGLGVDNG